MKSAWTVVAAFAILPSTAWAQELALPDPVLPSGMASTELFQEHVGQMRLSLALFGRISVPGDGNVSDLGLVYSDLFGVGVGGSLEGDLMTAFGGGLEIGGYLSAGYDSFVGTSATDDFGNTIDPDDMRITTVFVGGKARG